MNSVTVVSMIYRETFEMFCHHVHQGLKENEFMMGKFDFMCRSRRFILLILKKLKLSTDYIQIYIHVYINIL